MVVLILWWTLHYVSFIMLKPKLYWDRFYLQTLTLPKCYEPGFGCWGRDSVKLSGAVTNAIPNCSDAAIIPNKNTLDG